ncbi:MAG: TIGR00159 family protein [Phycisphaeraceae bacterium]|nr:TIGR00159 family protein [Phycisphaeraceae bacterium]
MNNLLESLSQIIDRVSNYLRTEPWVVLTELAVIWVVVYLIVRFLRGTRGARVIKGVAVLLIICTLSVQILGRENKFERLSFLYQNFMTLAAFILVIVFQPELRRAMVRIGEARLFRTGGVRRARVVVEILEAVEYLARNKIGALIAIEREVGLRGIVDLGTRLDAEVSRDLLKTIFWPGSALHDMGLVIHGDRMIAAGVQFPMTDADNLPQELGSRHRAAIGLSQETDALIIVVSEETGTISLAERGELRRGLTIDQLRPILTRGLGEVFMPPREPDNGLEAAPKESA